MLKHINGIVINDNNEINQSYEINEYGWLNVLTDEDRYAGDIKHCCDFLLSIYSQQYT